MAKKVLLKNTNSGMLKVGRYGFSWTYLFFGWWVPLFRGEIGISLLHLIATICTLGIWQIIFAFMYNKQHITRLLESGYKLNDTEDKMSAARSRLYIATQ